LKRLLVLVVLLLNFGCSSSYENVQNFNYEIPPLYISEKDCVGGSCVEINNYDINCKELSYSYGYDYCQINIDYRYDDSDYLSYGNNVQCKASIEVFDYTHIYIPERLSHTDYNYVNYSGNHRSNHYFKFNSYSETNGVYVTGIECGIDRIPPRPLTEEQKAHMDRYLSQICLDDDYVIKSPWDYCIKYIEEQEEKIEKGLK